jgi:hypothetical protein
MSVLTFSVKTSCGLVGRYQRFAQAHCLHFQGYQQAHKALQPRRPTSTPVSYIFKGNLVVKYHLKDQNVGGRTIFELVLGN